MIGKCSKLSLRSKVTLYKTYTRSVMTYASIVFAHAVRIHVDSLQVIRSHFCRIAVRTPWYVRNGDLHDDLNLESIRMYLKESSECYFKEKKAANYISDPNDGATQSRRFPKRILPREWIPR